MSALVQFVPGSQQRSSGSCPLVTTDFKDYAAINGLEIVAIRSEDTSSYPAAPPFRLISMLNRLIF